MDYKKIITTALIEKILSKGVRDMPQNPAAQGYDERQIRGFYYIPEREILNTIKDIETSLEQLFEDIKNNIYAFTERVNTQQLSINNAVSNAIYAKNTSLDAKEVAEDSFTVSASNTTQINQNATRINQLNDKIAVLEGANAYLIVSELPTANINPKIIYLLPATDSESNNVYEEYLYVNNKWELIGTTKNDLTNLNYDYLLNTPIYNSQNGLDYQSGEAVFAPLPKPCYMRFTGSSNELGLETGKIYYVTQVGAVTNYAPIDGSKPVTNYNELSGIPIYLSGDGSIAGTGENLINLQPGDYFKYIGNGEDGKGLTNGVIYFIGTKEVEGVISPTYTPINGQTKVLVNGQVVSEFNADTKVDKITPPESVNGGSYAYGTSISSKASGSLVTQNLIEYSSSNKPSTIPLRGGSGNFYIGEPTVGGHCATKNYVDGLALYKHNITLTYGNEPLVFTVYFSYYDHSQEVATREKIIELWQNNTILAKCNEQIAVMYLEEGWEYYLKFITTTDMSDIYYEDLTNLQYFNIADTVE